MSKFKDARRATPRAKLCPFIQGEPTERRHDRRLETAHASVGILRRWAETRGCTVEIKNDGQHWIVRHESDGKFHLGQWWPRSAKLVIRCRWKHGIHAHDVKQVIYELSEALNTIASGDPIRGAQ